MTTPLAGAAPARPPFWNDPAVRALVFQALALIAVIALGWYLVHNTQQNLAQRGIASGFGFLNNAAGFGIVQHLIDYSPADSYGRVFWIGLLNTLLVSVLGIVFATVLGFVVGIARLSRNWLVAKIAMVYVEIFRNIPLLLQIFFWYFAVLRGAPAPRNSYALGDSVFLNIRGLYVPRPVFGDDFVWVLGALAIASVGVVLLRRWAHRRQEATGQPFPVFIASLALLVIVPGAMYFAAGQPLAWDVPKLVGFNFRGGWVVIPELAALLVALTLYTATFIAETVRAGILSVSHGQTEAAGALGLPNGLTLRLIVIPQAMRVIIPPLTSQYLNLAKNSTLAAAIGYPDLVATFAGTVLNQTGQAIETIAITMSVYLALSLGISMLMNWYNKRKALVER